MQTKKVEMRITRIDSVKMIHELRKGSILSLRESEQNYKVATIEEGFMVLRLSGDERILKMVRFPDLIKDGWHKVETPVVE